MLATVHCVPQQWIVMHTVAYTYSTFTELLKRTLFFSSFGPCRHLLYQNHKVRCALFTICTLFTSPLWSQCTLCSHAHCVHMLTVLTSVYRQIWKKWIITIWPLGKNGATTFHTSHAKFILTESWVWTMHYMYQQHWTLGLAGKEMSQP